MKKEKSRRAVGRLSEEQVAYIVEHYHDTSMADIAAALGISVHTVKSRRDKMKLHHDKEYISRINSERAIKCNNAERLNTPESREKSREARAALFRAEKARVTYGLPQKTKRRFTTEPRASLMQRNRLQRLGYIVDNKEKVAYWTEQTKRAVRIEKVPRGKKVGSIRCYYDFRPLAEKEGNL